MNERVVRFGVVASSLCAVHCAVCAFLPAFFGVLGLGFLLRHEVEWLFTLVAIGFAFGALIAGWRKHSSGLVAGLFCFGVVGLLASRGIEMGSGHHDHESHHVAAEAEGLQGHEGIRASNMGWHPEVIGKKARRAPFRTEQLPVNLSVKVLNMEKVSMRTRNMTMAQFIPRGLSLVSWEEYLS